MASGWFLQLEQPLFPPLQSALLLRGIYSQDKFRAIQASRTWTSSPGDTQPRCVCSCVRKPKTCFPTGQGHGI
ncbi:hypothetical protein LY76DRAFT_598882 [Colletotrichum caudatum]|nr:hypothetical protein LY76DRAFT_598882 [Colletotrichum caudatum]